MGVNRLVKVNVHTPLVDPKAIAAKMTAAEKKSSAKRKTGPSKIKHAVTASGRRRKTTKKSLTFNKIYGIIILYSKL